MLRLRRKKADRAIVFGITGNLDFALGALIVGFKKHNPDYDGQIVVLHEGLGKKQQATFRKLFPKISFRVFTEARVRERCAGLVNPDTLGNVLEKYSHFYFAKFEIFDLLDEFESVFWMDVDMLVRGPLDDIWHFREFCWRETAKSTQGKQRKMYDAFADSVRSQSYRTPNGGLVGVARAAAKKYGVNSRTAYSWFAKFCEKMESVQGDEFATFMCAAEFGADVRLLDTAYNCPSATKGTADARIVHAVGRAKFWNNHALKLAYPDWWLWYREWVRIGGRKMKPDLSGGGVIKAPDEIVYGARFETQWLDLYERIWDNLPADFVPDILTHRKFYQIFLKGWPKKHAHIEVTALDKNFDVSFHVEREATEHSDVLHEVSERLTNFSKTEHKYGLAWSKRYDAADLAAGVLELATALDGLAAPIPPTVQSEA